MLAETLSILALSGTCYRAANCIEVGATCGFAKSNTTYTEHGLSKRILVYPLVVQARAILSRPLPHARLPRMQIKSLDLSDAQARALLDRLATIDEVRSRLGRRHSQRSVLALAVCAFISGARGSNEMAKWVERANPALLRRLRCRGSHTPRFAPQRPTLRRMLSLLPVEQPNRCWTGCKRVMRVQIAPVRANSSGCAGDSHKRPRRSSPPSSRHLIGRLRRL